MVKVMILMSLMLLPTITSGVVFYTISGFSSGGFMATQLHLSYSSAITGVGLVAAGPYYCSQGSVKLATSKCTYSDSPIDIAPLIAYAESMSSQGFIDPVSNLGTSTVYIFSGSADILILPQIVESSYRFYKNFVPSSQITFINSIPANHAWPTENKGNPCWYRGQYSINACGYDGSGIVLTTLLGPLIQGGIVNSSNIFTFSQSKYANTAQSGLDPNGIIYIPSNCQEDPQVCDVHIHFHGCSQNYQSIQMNYIQRIEMNGWAEANDIVVIYPQVSNAQMTFGGCWDIFGYTGKNFAIKSGIQISAIHNIAQDYLNVVRSVFK